MKLSAHKTELSTIQFLRRLFLQETNFQVRYDVCHQRGWSDSYILTIDDAEVGYGSIKGQEIEARDTIFEFYVIPPFRKFANRIFPELISASGATLIECQSNDFILSSMLYEFAHNISADVVLFEENVVTHFSMPDVVFRQKKKGDKIFEHQVEPVGEYVLERGGEIVATGGFAVHYNMPFADLYMEVKQDSRNDGLGSFLLQELKKACYLAGRVPAARCAIANQASRATLLKAGLKVCGFMLMGTIKTPGLSKPQLSPAA